MAPASVFVNHVDRYVGRELSKLLAESVINATTEEEEEEEEEEGAQAAGERYTVIGTLSSPDAETPKWVAEVVDEADGEAVRGALLRSDLAVYDISGDSRQVPGAVAACEALLRDVESFAAPKTFVCVSSVMTWAKTKPADPDDPETPIAEDEFRRRRPHNHFRAHADAEKAIVKAGKNNGKRLNTYVVAAGLPYGAGEGPFHGLFRQAWELKAPALPLYGEGDNVVPTVHVSDLAAVVLRVLESRPGTRYVLALDQAQNTLAEITAAISTAVGPASVAQVDAEEAFATSTISQADADMLGVNLRLEAGAVNEMGFEWRSQEGLVENVRKVVREYKVARGLTPIKLAVLGPPGSGKTTTAARLAKHYKLHHLQKERVIADTLARLEASAKTLEADPPPESTEQAEADQEKLEGYRAALEENKGVWGEEQLVAVFKDALLSMPCRNHGFVLDGFPETEAQAAELFAKGDEEEEEEEEGEEEEEEANPDAPNPVTVPSHVFAFKASDEFLKERIMNLPEAEVAGTGNTEEAFTARLVAYRAANTEDSTVLNYFDFKEIHPEYIDAAAAGADADAAFNRVTAVVGGHRNYGPTPEEAAEAARLEKLATDAREAEEARAKAVKDAAVAKEDAEKQAAWEAKRAEVKRQEEETLRQASLPLRNFLMENVMPTLTQGLVEVCKTRPDDPVDYLAEYLFKKNPQIS